MSKRNRTSVYGFDKGPCITCLLSMFQFSGLRRPLPKNVHLLTLEPWKDNALLMRFEHVYEVDEHPELSGPVTFNVDVSWCAYTLVLKAIALDKHNTCYSNVYVTLYTKIKVAQNTYLVC